MKSKLLILIFVCLAAPALAQEHIFQATPFTRSLLRAPDSPAARSILGLQSTNATLALQPDNLTLQTNIPGNVEVNIVAVKGNNDLPSANLPHVRSAIAQGRWWSFCSFGDSIAAWQGSAPSGVGWYADVMNGLQRIFGVGGYEGVGFDTSYFNQFSSGNVGWVTDTNVWFTYFSWATNTPWTVGWGAPFNGGNLSVTGNVAKVCYVAQSGAGSFEVQTNINNSGWQTVPGLASVSADNAGAPQGVCLTVFSNTVAAPYQVQCVGISGSVQFVAGAIDNTTGPGVGFDDFSHGGSALGWFFDAPTNITGPILQGLSPTLMTLVWYTGVPDLQNLQPFVDFMHYWCTNTDLVLIGSPPIEDWPAYNNYDTNVVACNALMRSVGYSNQVPYFDAHSIFGSWTNGYNAGFFQPGGNVHLTSTGYQFWADAFWNWLGLNGTALNYGDWPLQKNWLANGQTAPATLAGGLSVSGGPLTVNNSIVNWSNSIATTAIALADLNSGVANQANIIFLNNGVHFKTSVGGWNDFMDFGKSGNGTVQIDSTNSYDPPTLGSQNPWNIFSGNLSITNAGRSMEFLPPGTNTPPPPTTSTIFLTVDTNAPGKLFVSSNGVWIAQ